MSNIELQKKEQEALKYVKNHAKVEHWEQEDTGEKETWIHVYYYPDGQSEGGKLYSRYFSTPDDSEKEKKEINIHFKQITQDIVQDLIKNINFSKKTIEKESKWVFKERIYKVCPEMLCGNNPCSCEEEEK